MSGMINFNAQIAPMEHVEKVARHEQEHGQIRQEALMQKASQLIRRDNEQVQKSALSKKGRKVLRQREDDENSRKGSGFAEKEREGAGQAEGDGPAASTPGAVWSGNIVNIKV